MSVLFDKLDEIIDNLPDYVYNTIMYHKYLAAGGRLSRQAYLDLVEAVVMAYLEMDYDKESS